MAHVSISSQPEILPAIVKCSIGSANAVCDRCSAALQRLSVADHQCEVQLVHGVHGRLDDGRCLVERLAPDEHGVVRFRLAPEEPVSAQMSEELAAPPSPAPALYSPAPLIEIEPAQAPASVHNHAPAAAAEEAAEALSYDEGISPSQNLSPAEVPGGWPGLQSRPASSSQGGDLAVSPLAAQSAQPAPQSTSSAQNVASTRLSQKSPGPGQGLRLRLEASPAALALAAPLTGALAPPLAAPHPPRPVMSRHSSETVSATFEGAMTCTEFASYGKCTPAKQPQQQAGGLDQPALVMPSADHISGTQQCLRLGSDGRRSESSGMQVL